MRTGISPARSVTPGPGPAPGALPLDEIIKGDCMEAMARLPPECVDWQRRRSITGLLWTDFATPMARLRLMRSPARILAALHMSQGDTLFAANRFLSTVSKCFSWGAQHGLLAEGHNNPAKEIERYREHRRERFLTSEELTRLGDTLREGETAGGDYESKHAPKEENRRTVLDPFAIAAIRLLILTGERACNTRHISNRPAAAA
jgi:hypothetical protein